MLSFHNQTQKTLSFIWVLAVLLGLSGCRYREVLTPWRSGQTESNKTFRIDYTLQNAVQELDPWSSFADSQLHMASWSSNRINPMTNQRSVDLSIEYPHPQHQNSTALATLKIYGEPLAASLFQQKPSPTWSSRFWPRQSSEGSIENRPDPEEVMTMELSQDQFVSLYQELNQEEYLDSREREVTEQSPVLLSVSKDDDNMHTSQVIAPRLHDLIHRVYQDGTQIVGNRWSSRPTLMQTSGIEAPTPQVIE